MVWLEKIFCLWPHKDWSRHCSQFTHSQNQFLFVCAFQGWEMHPVTFFCWWNHFSVNMPHLFHFSSWFPEADKLLPTCRWKPLFIPKHFSSSFIVGSSMWTCELVAMKRKEKALRQHGVYVWPGPKMCLFIDSAASLPSLSTRLCKCVPVSTTFYLLSFVPSGWLIQFAALGRDPRIAQRRGLRGFDCHVRLRGWLNQACGFPEPAQTRSEEKWLQRLSSPAHMFHTDEPHRKRR